MRPAPLPLWLAAPDAVDRVRQDRTQAVLDRLLVLLLVVGFFYNAYRYPFQINSTETSPTYVDTPWWLSAGKYLLVFALLAYAAAVTAAQRQETRIANPVHLALYALLSIVPVAAGIAVADAELAEIGIFFLVPLVLLLLFSGCRLPVRRMNRLLLATTAVAVVVNAVQVGLFLSVGRLPALAYEGSVSIRFGSFLDDPNGFGLVLAWMVPFVWYYLGGFRRAAMVTLLLACLLLTQSLTALVAMVLVGAMFFARYLLSAVGAMLWGMLLLIAVAVATAGLVIALWEPIQGFYSLFMLTKAGSIQGHAGALVALERVTPLSLLGVEPLSENGTESGYVNLLAFFGLIYVVPFLWVGASAIRRYLYLMTAAGSRETRAFAAGAAGFLVAVYAASVNLPLAGIYPINLFTGLLLAFSSARLVPDPQATR